MCAATRRRSFYRVAFRKTIYRTIEELQVDLDSWLKEYNEVRPHQERWCFGKAPMQTFLDALAMAREKLASGVMPDMNASSETRHVEWPASNQVHAFTWQVEIWPTATWLRSCTGVWGDQGRQSRNPSWHTFLAIRSQR
jgi:hypothetical protein